jgi:hypothetical protein
LLLGIVAILVISTVRFGRLARPLYHRSDAPVADGGVLNSRANPEALAESAVAGQVLMSAVLERSATSRLTDGTSARDVLSMLSLSRDQIFLLPYRCPINPKSVLLNSSADVRACNPRRICGSF